jgi:hypothetical protein
VALCRELDLLSEASVAIDGSKFKAVNARDKNFTEAKMKRRLERPLIAPPGSPATHRAAPAAGRQSVRTNGNH